jgi:hypothetical protein
MPDQSPISYERRPTTPKARTWRDDVSAEWMRFTANFTRENVVSNVKTLAWVVPLTLLIWIYAEREQVFTSKDEAVPFELVNIDSGRSVTLKPPQDKNLVLELQGPQARLQAVLTRLGRGQLPQGLKIEVPPNLETNQEHTLDALSLVRAQRIFADNGITVLSCQPPRLQVLVDQVVERDARVVRPPNAKNLDATFDPPTVKIRGPLSMLTRAEQAARQEAGGTGGLVVYADIRDDNRPPGHYPLRDVPLRRPQELDDERISIVGGPRVNASVDVKQADRTLRIPSMPVTVDAPDVVTDQYKVVLERPVLQNVWVTGPPEIIEAMEKPDFEPQPKARVVVTKQDVGDRRSKSVKYDLPDKVSVIDEDKTRTVEFRLVERSTLAP